VSDTLALATRLSSMTDAELVDTLGRREFSTSGVDDFFDLAGALLSHSSAQAALSRLDRGSLAALATVADLPDVTVTTIARALGVEPDAVTARLRDPVSMLLAEVHDERVTVYASVLEQLRAWPAFGLPSAAELVAAVEREPPAPVAESELHAIDRLAAERAFTATATVTTLLLELEREPARALARGGVALPDKKRLANALATDLDTAEHFLLVASLAGMVARENGTWLTTEQGSSWLLEPTPKRWRTLAGGWLRTVPEDIRRVLSTFTTSRWGDALSAHLAWLYPAGGEGMSEHVRELARGSELLGITANEEPSSMGALLISGQPQGAESALAPLLPAEVEQVYLQHDLSVVAPGPLTPAVDAQLRLIADAESRALAASYRISVSSINRALASGKTAASILDFLESVSLTGIPQPLDYLISESAARYGQVRVGELTGDGAAPGDPEYAARSYLRSDHADLLGTIAVDQSLAVLGLHRTGDHRLVSRQPLETVFWMLSDARYPVAAENGAGEIVLVRRKRDASAPRIAVATPVVQLVERLRASAAESGGEHAWLVKQLDAAIRSRSAVTASIAMPGGGVTEMVLEPASISGGRLRARDPNSDTERTLPLSSIVALGDMA